MKDKKQKTGKNTNRMKVQSQINYLRRYVTFSEGMSDVLREAADTIEDLSGQLDMISAGGDLIDRKALLDGMDKRYAEKKDIVMDHLAEGFVQMEQLVKEQPPVSANPGYTMQQVAEAILQDAANIIHYAKYHDREGIEHELSQYMAETYGNEGWIPCSSGILPEEKTNPVTKDFYEYQVTFQSDGVSDIRHYKFGNGHWWNYGQNMDQYVTAWRQNAKPYHAAGSVDESVH